MTVTRNNITSDPFMVAEAREAGITWDRLQTKRWVRLSRGQYVASAITRDVPLTLRAVAQRMPLEYAFSGLTAAWIHGLDVPASAPVEVTVPRDVSVRSRAGVKVRRAALPSCDVIVRRGFRVTAPVRTTCDLGGRKDLVESVVALDLALHAGLVTLENLAHHVAIHRGGKGIRRLRNALRLADSRSESPMETRLRVALVRARLPKPCVQSELHDAGGSFLARTDLYYPDCKLAIEYDGDNHKDRLAADVRRQNALINAGYSVLRFTAADLRIPDSVAREVMRARKLRLKNLG